MQQSTRDFIAALRFLGQLGKAARTAKEWTAIGQLWDEIRITDREGGDVGAILRRFDVAAPSGTTQGEHTRLPAPEPVVEQKSYFLDHLLRAIAATKSNSH